MSVHHFVWIERLIGVVGMSDPSWCRDGGHLHFGGRLVGVALRILIGEQLRCICIVVLGSGRLSPTEDGQGYQAKKAATYDHGLCSFRGVFHHQAW